jgi:hypothetical protein
VREKLAMLIMAGITVATFIIGISWTVDTLKAYRGG